MAKVIVLHAVVVDGLFVFAGLVDADDFCGWYICEDFVDKLFFGFWVGSMVHAVVFEFAQAKKFEVGVVEVTGDNDVSCMVGISQYNSLFADIVGDLLVACVRDTYFCGFVLVFVAVEVGDAPASLEC